MSFIDDYKIYTDPYEIPEIFNLWCALSSLSAAAQRKIWIDMGIFKICPNLYIILDGLPGRGKSLAMNIVRDLLEKVPSIKTKSDSITKESIYETMESCSQQFELGKTKLLLHSSLTIFANEMSLLIKKGDKDFVSALNSLFDSLGVFRHSTKTRGENVIVNPYLNILGGTTPDWIATNIQEDVIEGGLSARTILVWSDTPKQYNSYPQVTAEGQEAYKRMLERLERITQLGGMFTLTTDARAFWDIWYMDHFLKTKPSSPKMAGYHARKRLHLLKVAMLLSLAEKDALVLEETHIRGALGILNITEPAIEVALKAVGRNILSSISADILNIIRAQKRIKITTLYRENYWRSNEKELDEILRQLLKTQQITVEILEVNGTNDTYAVFKG